MCDRPARAFAPVPAIHRHLKGGLHRLLVVVLRGDGDGRGAALAVDVGVRLGRQEEAAIGGEREAVAGDFAIAGIGDARFDAIDQVLLLAVDAWSGTVICSLPSASSVPLCSVSCSPP